MSRQLWISRRAMSVTISSWVGPRLYSAPLRSFRRNSVSPKRSKRPVSRKYSAGSSAGMRISSAPARSISSRTMPSTLRSARSPSGR